LCLCVLRFEFSACAETELVEDMMRITSDIVEMTIVVSIAHFYKSFRVVRM